MSTKAKKATLESDGERMIPEFHKNNIIYGEHIGRYLAVEQIVKDKVTLDIASGSGYGTKMLSGSAKRVIGVDIDETSVRYAQENYAARNVEYMLGDAVRIPLEDASVDVVISMETIEHISDQDKFLREIKRVLSKNGVLAISTPNDAVYPKGNHFHVKEHNKKSLTQLLGKHFKNVALYFQTVDIAASLLEEKSLSTEIDKATWTLQKALKTDPDNSIYYLAVCSDGATPPLAQNTILAQSYSHLEQKEHFDTIHSLNNIINLKIQEIDGLKNRVDQQSGESDRMRKHIAELEKAWTYRVKRKIGAYSKRNKTNL